jgi:hypothetical protein
MKNFIDVGLPVASARIGEDELFVSELDESDGSITLFEPRVGIAPLVERPVRTLNPSTPGLDNQSVALARLWQLAAGHPATI